MENISFFLFKKVLQQDLIHIQLCQSGKMIFFYRAKLFLKGLFHLLILELFPVNNKFEEKVVPEQMTTRIRWTTEEEQYLRHLKDIQRVESWKQIAQKMGEEFQDSARSGKQCRQRYINYVRFEEKEPKSSSWTLEDDEKFTKLYFLYGAKWACIGKHMPDKSQNCLKNRFYGGLRRIIRKINKIQKILRARKTKPLRYETLMRVLDYKSAMKESTMTSQLKNREFDNFLTTLKSNLLQETWNVMNQNESDFKIFELVESIHEFNARIRGLTFKRSSNIQNVKKILQDFQRTRLSEPSTPHPDSSTVQKTPFHKELCHGLSEQIDQQLSMVQQKEIQQYQECEYKVEGVQQMMEFAPEADFPSNNELIDLESSNILIEEFKTQAFCFFY